MTTSIRGVLDDLRAVASEASSRAVVPYSGKPQGAVVLLDTGEVVPGVRVESASFSLVIPAVVNAITTAYALDRHDIAAIAGSSPLSPGEANYARSFVQAADFVDGVVVRSSRPGVPPVGETVSPFLLEASDAESNAESNAQSDAEPDQELRHGKGGRLDALEVEGVMLARHAARRAYVPESSFPVGTVARVDGGWVPGVNVEHADWTYVLCAERNLIGTLASFAIAMPNTMFLSCPRDLGATPCGACRQLLSEFLPDATIVIDRGSEPPDRLGVEYLLPGSFSGQVLRG